MFFWNSCFFDDPADVGNFVSRDKLGLDPTSADFSEVPLVKLFDLSCPHILKYKYTEYCVLSPSVMSDSLLPHRF